MNRITSLTGLKPSRWQAFGFTAMLALPASVLGNVYPTSLSQSGNSFSSGQSVTLGYLLNENATNVSVSILNASNTVVRTIAPGAQTKGSQSVMWDGKDNSNNVLPSGNYSFRVSSSGDTKAAWTQISTDSTLNNFELPRGVAVNKNPTSPYYGRVYVSNPRTTATGAGRAMSDGVYMLNADLTDTGIPGGTGPATGGVDWTLDATSSGISPFRLEVGPDSSVYITDWADVHSGLWQAPPDLSGNWTEVLENTNQDAGGLNATHGSISDVYITGTGANRVIYTADEDYTSPGSIQRYDIGTTTTYSGAPTATLFDNASNGNWNINFFNSIAVDKNGNFWYSQNRSNGTDKASLIEIDPTTGFIAWDSLNQLGSPDPLRTTQGIAYDPVNNVLALVTGTTAAGGNIVIFDPDAKAIVTQFAFGSTTNTDVAFDNAGNLYVGNRSAERVRIWSPPNGTGAFVANQFSTDSLAPLGSITFTAAAGVAGDFNHDGKVDGADLLVWQRTLGDAANLAIWKANFGQPPAIAATGAVPEPASAVLVAYGVAAIAAMRRRAIRFAPRVHRKK
jgi:hypothetical protein